jgi:hypothetical protein
MLQAGWRESGPALRPPRRRKLLMPAMSLLNGRILSLLKGGPPQPHPP